MALQGLHHGFHVPGRVHGAQAGEDVEIVLAEMHAIGLELEPGLLIAMTADDPVFLGDADHALDGGKPGHVFHGQARGVADEIDLGQGLLRAPDLMGAGLDVGQAGEVCHQCPVLGRIGRGVGFENEYHASLAGGDVPSARIPDCGMSEE